MKKILTFVLIVNSLLLASNSENNNKSKSRTETQIEKEMEKEKKYAKEQTFYTGKDYDLKGAEVNEESLSSIPAMEPEDDFDMNDVYD